jgi:hypothetical protein
MEPLKMEAVNAEPIVVNEKSRAALGQVIF